MTLNSCLLLRRCHPCIWHNHPQALYLAAKQPHQLNLKWKTVFGLIANCNCNISWLTSGTANEWASIAKPLATSSSLKILSWPSNGPQRDERGIRNRRADRQNTWRELFVLETTRPFDHFFSFLFTICRIFFFIEQDKQPQWIAPFFTDAGADK